MILVSHALYTECSPLNVPRLWTADVNSTLAVGQEVTFYCSNNPSLLMATVKCRQSGLWKITQRSLENIHQCNRIGKYQFINLTMQTTVHRQVNKTLFIK